MNKAPVNFILLFSNLILYFNSFTKSYLQKMIGKLTKAHDFKNHAPWGKEFGKIKKAKH